MNQGNLPKTTTLRVRFARRVNSLQQSKALRFEVDNFKHSAWEMNLVLPITSAKYLKTDADIKKKSLSMISEIKCYGFSPFIKNTSLGFQVFQTIDKKSIEDNFAVLQSYPMAQTTFLPKIPIETVQSRLSDIAANQIKQDVIFPNIAISSRERLFNPTKTRSLYDVKLHKLRSKKLSFNIITASSSQLSMQFARSKQPNLLGKAHNELLSCIDEGLHLIGEIDSGFEYYEEIKKEICLFIKKFGQTKAKRKIWAEYPGAAVSFLVLGAIYKYRHGDYWNLVLDEAGFSHTAPAQGDWGRHFLIFILAFGLNPLHEKSLRYVGSILGHAMIPNDCLPEFFGQLLEPAVRKPAFTGRSTQELTSIWLNRSSKYVGVDRPVWRFLRHGGSVVENFVSESLRMIRYRYDNGSIPHEKDLNLPTRVVQTYRELSKQMTAPLPRSPFIKLDPFAGLQLAFPDQKLPDEHKGQVCSWEILAAGQSFRGPSNYPQIRSGDVTFCASPVSIPPDGPYKIKLVVGRETVKEWHLEGITSEAPWIAFTAKNCRGINPIQAEKTWILIPSGASVNVLDNKGFLLPNAEIRRCDLIEDWYDYQSVLVDLTAADAIKIICENSDWLVNIEHREGDITITGGDLIQSAEKSPDQIDLFGCSLPDIIMTTKPGDEKSSIDLIRIRVAGSGISGSTAVDLCKDDIIKGTRMEPARIVCNINNLIKPELCPGEITIILWFKEKRLCERIFRWAPQLLWKWEQDGRTAMVNVPEGATLVEKAVETHQRVQLQDDGCYLVTLPEEANEIDLDLTWQGTNVQPFVIPFRLYGPQWAYLKKRSDTPVWKYRPIEICPEDILNEDNSYIMIETSDIAWQTANLRAIWTVAATGNPTVRLPISDEQRDRRLIHLAQLADTLRTYQSFDSQLVVEGYIHGSIGNTIQICLMRLKAQKKFRWAFQLEKSATQDWREVCIDKSLEDILTASSPHIIFDTMGGGEDKMKLDTFWQPLDENKGYRKLTSEACKEKGRWRIDLYPVIKILEKYREQTSEVCIEIMTEGSQRDEGESIALMRIHLQPVGIKTIDDCIRLAEENPLFAVALDFLSSLHYKHRFSLDVIAADLLKFPEMVKNAYRLIKLKCPEITVDERQNSFTLAKETFYRIRSVLSDWDNMRY